jgi:hypothetical protein
MQQRQQGRSSSSSKVESNTAAAAGTRASKHCTSKLLSPHLKQRRQRGAAQELSQLLFPLKPSQQQHVWRCQLSTSRPSLLAAATVAAAAVPHYRQAPPVAALHCAKGWRHGQLLGQ